MIIHLKTSFKHNSMDDVKIIWFNWSFFFTTEIIHLFCANACNKQVLKRSIKYNWISSRQKINKRRCYSSRGVTCLGFVIDPISFSRTKFRHWNFAHDEFSAGKFSVFFEFTPENGSRRDQSKNWDRFSYIEFFFHEKWYK